WVPSVTHGMAQHAFTASAIAHMTLVVMSRAALGHNGLPLKADPSCPRPSPAFSSARFCA
ncbi:MAG: NnrS family protein, partial [Pseudomonadota bacterium]|nr:NnrS family protein [Pseudomonadota bacterium]